MLGGAMQVLKTVQTVTHLDEVEEENFVKENLDENARLEKEDIEQQGSDHYTLLFDAMWGNVEFKTLSDPSQDLFRAPLRPLADPSRGLSQTPPEPSPRPLPVSLRDPSRGLSQSPLPEPPLEPSSEPSSGSLSSLFRTTPRDPSRVLSRDPARTPPQHSSKPSSEPPV
eukprot:g15899.t1